MNLTKYRFKINNYLDLLGLRRDLEFSDFLLVYFLKRFKQLTKKKRKIYYISLGEFIISFIKMSLLSIERKIKIEFLNLFSKKIIFNFFLMYKYTKISILIFFFVAIKFFQFLIICLKLNKINIDIFVLINFLQEKLINSNIQFAVKAVEKDAIHYLKQMTNKLP